ncbi:ATP dependent DNA ligase domain protein [compost metagenome]
MLAHPIDKVDPSKIDWENAFAQPKLDGHRCLVNGILYSRNGKEILLPHIRDFLGDYGLLDKKLDGELYVHGTMLQDIGSLVKKPREESLQLRYHVYDVISDVPYADRHAWLADVLSEALVADSAPISLVPTHRVVNRDELTSLHNDWKAAGYEGSMLRHGLSGYEDDKRSSSLLKVKDFSDAEFIVLDVERGTPNGEFEVPVWVLETSGGLRFKATAAGTMQQKHEQWVYRRDYIGRPLTVQFFGHSKDGVPLLPVALRWREDV